MEEKPRVIATITVGDQDRRRVFDQCHNLDEVLDWARKFNATACWIELEAVEPSD